MCIHQENEIHGNLKPNNILFGKNEQISLTDFKYSVLFKDYSNTNEM